MKPLTKIIIADDEQDILEIIKYSLEDLKDVEVLYCRSGKEVLNLMEQFQPDLIILDYMMPELDGGATLKAIRKYPSFSHTPIIFLTAKIQKK